MAAVGPWVVFNDFRFALGKKLVELTTDTFKVALVTASSNAINAALVGALYSALTNELTTANGYTATGAAASSPTWVGGGATATATFDTADVSWTGSGAGFTARAAVLYDVTTGHLIAYCLLDSSPADYVVAPAAVLTLNIVNVVVLS